MSVVVKIDQAAPFIMMLIGAYTMWTGQAMEAFAIFIIAGLWRIENLLEYGSPYWDEMDEETPIQ